MDGGEKNFVFLVFTKIKKKGKRKEKVGKK